MEGKISNMYSRFQLKNSSNPKYLYVWDKEFRKLLSSEYFKKVQKEDPEVPKFFGMEIIEVFRESFLAVGD